MLTFVVLGRKPLFNEATTARAAAREMAQPRLAKTSEILAWVLMPDHFHCLARLGAGDALSKLVNRLKSASAREVNRVLMRSGPLWQSGYHERAVRNEASLRTAARYIVANPLRAGLVDRIGNYPNWNACWLDGSVGESWTD